jgi:hypothetical protein
LILARVEEIPEIEGGVGATTVVGPPPSRLRAGEIASLGTSDPEVEGTLEAPAVVGAAPGGLRARWIRPLEMQKGAQIRRPLGASSQIGMPPSSFGARNVTLLNQQLAQTHGRCQCATLMGTAKRRLSPRGIATILQQLAKHSSCLRFTLGIETGEEHLYSFPQLCAHRRRVLLSLRAKPFVNEALKVGICALCFLGVPIVWLVTAVNNPVSQFV